MVNNIKVTSTIQVVPLGSFIEHSLHKESEVTMTAFGPAAIANAVKAISIAVQHGKKHGLAISCVPYPYRETFVIDDKEKLFKGTQFVVTATKIED